MLRSRFLSVALLATAVTTLAAKPALADALVKVPFSFTVKGKLCPAGTYLLKGDATSNTVTLLGHDSSKIFSWIIVPRINEIDPSRIVLQFDQAGSDHALRSIQYGSQGTSRLDRDERRSEEMQDAGRGGR